MVVGGGDAGVDDDTGDLALGEGAGVLTHGTSTSCAFVPEVAGEGDEADESGIIRFESSSCSTAQT